MPTPISLSHRELQRPLKLLEMTKDTPDGPCYDVYLACGYDSIHIGSDRTRRKAWIAARQTLIQLAADAVKLTPHLTDA